MKEVNFPLIFLLLFSASPFCYVQLLDGFPFCEAVILYSLFCSKNAPKFFFFCVLPNLWFEKLKLYPILLILDWFHA